MLRAHLSKLQSTVGEMVANLKGKYEDAVEDTQRPGSAQMVQRLQRKLEESVPKAEHEMVLGELVRASQQISLLQKRQQGLVPKAELANLQGAHRATWSCCWPRWRGCRRPMTVKFLRLSLILLRMRHGSVR